MRLIALFHTTTHLVGFQEIAPIVKTRDLTVPRRKIRDLFYEDIDIDYKPVHKTKEPEKLVVEICDTFATNKL